MKKYFVIALFSLIFIQILTEELSSSEPVSCNKNYFKAFGGANFIGSKNTHRVKYHVGEAASLAVGRYLHPFLRTELEVSYRNNPMTYHVHTKEAFYSSSTAAMINVLGDLPFIKYDIQPFVGAGLGSLISHEYYFSWQMIGGLNYSLSSKVYLSLEYRVLKAVHHAYNHSVGVGFTYKFY